MTYGTIGTSLITDEFIQGAKLIDGLELTAVYSRNLEKGLVFSQKYGVQTVFTNLEQMASSDMIDAVYIASPNALHYEQSKLFLEHGKNVLCEKPITVTSSQLKELINLAKQKNLVYIEAIMMLHLPARLLLQNSLHKIGNITTVRFDFSQLSSKYQSYLNGDLPNIFNPKFATGCLMDIGVYCIYPAIDLFGIPQKIVTTACFLTTGADGYGNSIFLYKDKQINLSYSKIGQSRLGSEIIGDKGTIIIESISRLANIKIVFNDGSEESITGDIPKHVLMSGEANSFYNYVTNIIKYEKEYQYACDLSVKVCEVMEIMREQSNIKF
jgi:predicted dehydrogenase